jgi:hypothetical protein
MTDITLPLVIVSRVPDPSSIKVVAVASVVLRRKTNAIRCASPTTEKAPAACAIIPHITADEYSPVAKVLELDAELYPPRATANSADAEQFLPMAVLLTPEVVLRIPIETLSLPDATHSYPNATVHLALLVEEKPPTIEY